MKAVCKCKCEWFFNLSIGEWFNHLDFQETSIAVCNKCRTPYQIGFGGELRELASAAEDRFYLQRLSIDPSQLVEHWGFTVVPLPTPKTSLLDTLIML